MKLPNKSVLRRLVCAGITVCITVLAQADRSTQIIQERLAKHAGLFKEYETNRRVEDAKPNSQGIIDLSPESIVDYGYSIQPVSPQQEITSLAKHVEAVLQGTMQQRYSALSAGRSFVYSDWVVRVTKVYKYSPSIFVQTGQEITVVRSGGEIMLNGRRVLSRDKTFPDFTLGHEYVLFLRGLPESSSFRAFSGGTFDVSGPKAIPVLDPGDHSTGFPAFCASLSTAGFLSELERSIAQ